MDSVNRIFNLVNEAKKGKGKAMIPTHHQKKGGKKNFGTGKKNPYDHDHVSEAKKLSKKQMKIAGMAGDPKKIDSADLAALRAGKKKVNASTEIANILNLIKEAYQDELISEEAFLAIADPIMRSLMEEEKEPGHEGHGIRTTKRSRRGEKVPKPRTTPAAGQALGASIRKKAAKYVDTAAKKAF